MYEILLKIEELNRINSHISYKLIVKKFLETEYY